MLKNGQAIDEDDFIIELIAGEALSARDACYISTADGKAYKCDADDLTKMDFVGFAQEAASSSATVRLITSGIAYGFSGLTIGAKYYLSGTSGAITATAPTNVTFIGTAVSATIIRMDGFRTVRVIVFTGSGTWTKRPGLKYINVELVGGGGGGQNAGNLGGGGGGGGGYSRKMILVASLGSTETVTIGAGGGSGSPTGVSGGTTSFGSHCSATGGGGGGSDGSYNRGGGGGIGSDGDINIRGGGGAYIGPGSTGSGSSNNLGGGVGGSSLLGGGGWSIEPERTPGDGGLYGGGGAGASDNSSGSTGAGAGAAGIVIVTEHY